MILQHTQSASRRMLSILLIVFVLANLPAEVLAAQGDTIRISVSTGGTQGNNHSYGPSISSDGRYVAFTSTASNLVAGDTNGMSDVFVFDRLTGTTTRVSVDSNGGQANLNSNFPSISNDGRYVAFVSDATNLVTGDTNGMNDVFVHNLVTGETTRVSVDSAGAQANDLSYSVPSISSDGRLVAFDSAASNLVAGDTNGRYDIFVHDRTTGETMRVSVDSGGVQGDHDSTVPSISPDGRYVLFDSYASNLVAGDTNGVEDVFVHDRTTGRTTRVSVDSGGAQANNYSNSYGPCISSGGRFVAFTSAASDLVDDDTNGATDIFVHDRTTGDTSRVSVSSSGTQGDDDSIYASISPDGRYVAFESQAKNLVTRDTGGLANIFAHDHTTGATTLVSAASSGEASNDQSYSPSISSGGRYVAFQSYASNLVDGDTNAAEDVFVHEPDYAMAPPIQVVPGTGFAPGRITTRSPQIIYYADLGDLWLEIPRLGVRMNIVGVPQVGGKWDVSWLGKDAGWLNGSAFPTWKGNSVLTGHVYDAFGKPGPFHSLNTLWWGDKVIVHAGGGEYVYEVRTVTQVSPDNAAAMLKHEELPWLTLVTCRGYDKASNFYKYRVLVRAVLVEVK